MKKPSLIPSSAEFIRNDGNWPQWPRLPLKRGAIPGQELAIITPVESDGTVTLYHANMFEVIHMNTRITKYPSVDALLADGWTID